MATPYYITLSLGQMRIWRTGTGSPVVVLPGLGEAANVAADRVARHLSGACVTALEWPGVGGSASLPFENVADLTAVIKAAVDVLGLADAPLLAFDLACGVAVDLSQSAILIAVQTARAWSQRDFAPPDLTPREDGTHLTALWAHLRNAALMAPADPIYPRRDGDALPSASDLDTTVVSAAVDPESFAMLWSVCLAAAGSDSPSSARLADRLETVDPEWLQTTAPAPMIPATPPRDEIWCDYVDIPATRIHLRRGGSRRRALMVMQSAPGTTAPLRPVIEGLSPMRHVIAPDFPGNGDSGKSEGSVDVVTLARNMLAVADAMQLDSFDLWGTHTGAVVALEMALIAPGRVGRLIMEAPPILPADFTSDILDNYLPPLQPDRWGLHLQQAWNMRRDMFLFWPWYRCQREAVRTLGLPPVRFLHDWTVGLLKSGITYGRSYRAAFEYRTAERLPLLSVPALITAGPMDMLTDGLETMRRIAPRNVDICSTPATVWYPNQSDVGCAQTIGIYRAFLERGD